MAGKSIGLWSAVSIGVGSMIGAGIFSILGVAAQIAGRAMYLSFIIAGAIALLSTYSFARLGSRYPSASGAAEFILRGFGDTVTSGGLNILLWIAYMFALSLYGKAFAGYAMTLLPSSVPALLENVLSTAIILVFMAVNFVGARAVGKTEVVIVAVKVAVLVLFVIAGLLFVDTNAFSFSQLPGTSNILYGAAIVFLAYEGFGLIANAAGDMRQPKVTLPQALFISVVLTMVIYVLVSVTVLGNLPLSDIIAAKDYALAAAAEPFLGRAGFTLMAVAALFSTSSAINAMLYGGANISYALAKYGELPETFERKVWGESTEGLFITVGIVILFVNILTLNGIAIAGSAAILIIYLAVHVSHLRLQEETGANVLVILASIVASIVFLAIVLYYAGVTSPSTLVILAVMIAGAFLTEWLYRRYADRVLKP